MQTFNIVEKFVSIDGEGPMSGRLAVFIRFLGCNLRCSWCDTSYSWEEDEDTTQMTTQEIVDYIQSTGVHHITLTGGEPLMQEGIEELLLALAKKPSLLVHVETNGSVNLAPFKQNEALANIRYIVDYKLPASNMTSNMCDKNLMLVDEKDTYKFVIASEEDLAHAYQVILDKKLDRRCQVYFSPVSDNIDPSAIVTFMKDKNLLNVRLQLQLHKIIWSKEAKGV